MTSDDLRAAADQVMKALMLRAQYMVWSLQKFPRVAARCMKMLVDENFIPALISDDVLDEILDSSPATASRQSQSQCDSVLVLVDCVNARHRSIRDIKSSRPTRPRGQNFRPRPWPRPRPHTISFSRRLSSWSCCQLWKSRHPRYVLL